MEVTTRTGRGYRGTGQVKPLSLNGTGGGAGKKRLGPEQTSPTGGHYKDRQRVQRYRPMKPLSLNRAGKKILGPEQASRTGGHYKDRQRYSPMKPRSINRTGVWGGGVGEVRLGPKGHYKDRQRRLGKRKSH